MRVGLDLDNTIIDYSESFSKIAKTLGFVNENWNGNKLETKKLICSKRNGEQKWMALQGKVYGEYLKYAVPSPGLNIFLNDLKKFNV